MSDPTVAPWWAKFIPDLRAWATLGMFGLAAYTLHLAASNPSLAQNEIFKTLATLLFGTGGFGLVCAFLWGGSKASVAAAETVNALASAPAQPVPGTVTTIKTPPAKGA